MIYEKYGLKVRLPAKCKCCKLTFQKIHIHHKDGNHDNNSKLNLVKLCEECHAYIHQVLRLHSPKLKHMDPLRIDLIDYYRNYLFKSKNKKRPENEIQKYMIIQYTVPKGIFKYSKKDMIIETRVPISNPKYQ